MARSLLRWLGAVPAGRTRPAGPTLRYAMVLGVALAALVGFFVLDQSARAQGERTIVLKTTVTTADTGRYKYLPFDMPSEVNRMEVVLTKTGSVPVVPPPPGEPPTSGTPASPREGTSVTGLGIFDERGAQYDSPGFRGIYGEEDQDFFIENDTASVSFTPGPINPGRWTVIVPVFRGVADEITVTVKLTTGPEKATPTPVDDIEQVSDEPGWYGGDLHDHTTESSDSRSSGSARTPEQFPDEVKNAGLDFVSLTDHNVTSQNRNIGTAAAGKGVLVMPGLEMTNWFHGHATVTGLEPGDWLDWRQRPQPSPTFENEARIDEFIKDTEREGRDVFTSAAHPSIPPIDWDFFQEAEARPELLPDALEVWTGPFQPDDELSLERFDELLKRSIADKRYRIVANGASDIHGFDNNQGFELGKPTTVVHADALSKPAVVDALEAGRSFITKSPTGPELYLSATADEGTPGAQRQIVGGTIYGEPTTTVKVSVLVRGGNGRRLELLRDGERFQTTPITSDEQTVTLDQPVGTGGFVRAELRGSPRTDPNPVASELDMEALTNPIFLERRPVPPGTGPDPTGASGSSDRDAEKGSSGSNGDGAATSSPPGPGVLGTSAAEPRVPALRLSVRPRRAVAGQRVRFRFRAFVRTGARSRGRGFAIRPVAGATVRFAGATLRTDRGGYATLVARVPPPGLVRAVASRAGLEPALARVRALRRR